MLDGLKMKCRGVKVRDDLYVLKHTKAPAVLIEVGFISNDKEATSLFCEKCQDDIAAAIADGIAKTFG
jgi:N-acetylmuramoyl-L-alanine amidase